MKRKVISFMLVFVSLLQPLSASPLIDKEVTQEEAKSDVRIKKLEYKDLEDIVRKNNKTIQSNKKIIQGLRLREGIEKKQQELNDAYGDLESLYNALIQASDMLANTPWDIDNGDEEIEEGEEGVVPGLPPMPSPNDIAVRTAIMTLMGGISELSNSLMTNIYDAIELIDVEDEYIDKVELELEEINDQIVMGTQLLYIAHEYLQLQLDDLDRKQEVLDYNIQLAQTKYDVGMMTENELMNAKMNQTPLDSGRETLKLEMETLKDKISALIYEDYDMVKELGPLPELKDEDISMINYHSDLNLARSKNYGIKQKSKSVDIAKTRLDDNKYEEDIKGIKLNKEAAELAYDGELKNFETSFKRLYKEIGEKKRLLDEEQKYYDMELDNYRIAELKYTGGLDSRLNYTMAKDKLDLKELDLNQAKMNLFMTLEKYNWALRGYISQEDSMGQ